MGTVAVISLLAGAANLIGGGCSLFLARSRTHLQCLTALGAGFLLGSALLLMIPATLQASRHGHLAVAAGFFGLLLIQRLSAQLRGSPVSGAAATLESAWATFLGLALHTFFEGAMLGVVVHAGHQVGWLVLLALVLHKLPEGFTLSGLVLAATGCRHKALWSAAIVGLVMVAGTWTAVVWSRVATLSHGYLLGMAAGAFLYASAADMLPALVRKGWLHIGLLLMGVLLAHGTTAH